MRLSKHGKLRRGAALVAVLGIVAILSIIVVLYIDLSYQKIRRSALGYGTDSLRSEAYSTLETAFGVLQEYRVVDGALYSPVQGWDDVASNMTIDEASGLTISVDVEDESGKISLKRIDPDLMRYFLEALGLDLLDAEHLRSVLVDWTDPDDNVSVEGAEKDEYEFQGKDVLPPNGPITSYDEIQHLMDFDQFFFDEEGTPNSLFEQFKAATTLHYDGPVNLNTAPSVVLEAMEKRGTVSAEQLMEERNGFDGIPGTDDDTFLRSTPNGSVTAQMLRITVRVSRGDTSFQLQCLLSMNAGRAPNGGVQLPFQIERIAENSTID